MNRMDEKPLSLRPPRILLLVYLCLSVVLLRLLASRADLSVLSILKSNVAAILAVIVFESLYCVMKASAWLRAWRSQGIPLSFKGNLSLFFKSAFIDATVFPSGVSSDSFKFASVGKYPARQKLTAIALCRVCSLVPVVVALILYSLVQNLYLPLLAVAIIGVLLSLRFQRGLAVLKSHRRSITIIVAFSAAAFLADATRAYALTRLFSSSISEYFILHYAVCAALGYLVALPMGLGIRDAGFWFFLSPELTGYEIGAFLLLLRLTGEIPAAVIGWGLFGSSIAAMGRS